MELTISAILDKNFPDLYDQELINEINEHGRIVEVPAGQVLFEIGDYFKSVPLLVEGIIKIIREDDEGRELLMYYLKPGETCAMSLTCCMAKSVSKIRAIADDNVKVIMIPIDNMKQWFHNNESWRNFILQSYQVRFDEMLDTIDTLAFMKMDERLYKYLTDKVKLSASTTLEITHQEIAEDLHTSRVVISRLLKQLEIDNKLKLGRNRISILEF